MNEKKPILVAGASGALGIEIVKILHARGEKLRVLTSSNDGVDMLTPYTRDIWKGDASKEFDHLKNITSGIDMIISALGNSVSLFTNNHTSFYETDYLTNKHILEDAEKNSVKRFVYISIKGAQENMDAEVAKGHRLFEKALQDSAIDHTIIRPVGFFSGINDLIIMAKRKFIPVIGNGEARTNSIHHFDLAKVAADILREGPELMEIGGPEVHTREEMAKMISENFGGQVVRVPESIAEMGIVFSNVFKDFHDKLEYFKFITTHDMIAEKHGSITFKEYLKSLDKKQLP